MQAIRSKLSYANVISTLCLFLILGGSAYAATQLPKNSVGAKQIKNGAITGAKIKKASIEAVKLTALAQSTLKGATGPRGPKGATGAKGLKGDKGERGQSGERGERGPQGEAGSTGAYASVADDSPPEFEGAHPGFTAVESPATGVYCLTPAAGINIEHPLASSNWLGASGQGFFIEPLAGGGTSECADGMLEVHTYRIQESPDPNEVVPTDEVSITVYAAGN